MNDLKFTCKVFKFEWQHLEICILADSSQGCTDIDGVDDSQSFNGLKKALSTFGIDGRQQFGIWSVLSAILHLGNINFSQKIDSAFIQNTTVLNIVGKLIGCTPSQLEKALCCRNFQGRDSFYSVPLTVPQAIESRDALAKTVYGHLFNWFVQKINQVNSWMLTWSPHWDKFFGFSWLTFSENVQFAE